MRSFKVSPAINVCIFKRKPKQCFNVLEAEIFIFKIEPENLNCRWHSAAF